MSALEPSVIGIIEDDIDIGAILEDTLKDSGYTTHLFTHAGEFEASLKTRNYALCLVDLGLPDQNGLDVVKNLNTRDNIPCIIISGRRELSDRIVGLELGADDYIAKPFEPPEIVARVRTVLRRVVREEQVNATTTANTPTRFSFDDWTVDLNSFELTHTDGNIQRISSAELNVLRAFLESPNQLLTRDQILDKVAAGDTNNFDRAVDVRISRLRSKLRDTSQNPKLIKTIYGAGYIFVSKVQQI